MLAIRILSALSYNLDNYIFHLPSYSGEEEWMEQIYTEHCGVILPSEWLRKQEGLKLSKIAKVIELINSLIGIQGLFSRFQWLQNPCFFSYRT